MPSPSPSRGRWPPIDALLCVAATGAGWFGLVGCGAEAPPQDPVARGKMIYGLNCTMCHNADPLLEGTLGPEVAGSSRELLEARVLRGEYPPGYVPKRSTASMVPMPWLQSSIPDLAAYLQSLGPAAGSAGAGGAGVGGAGGAAAAAGGAAAGGAAATQTPQVEREIPAPEQTQQADQNQQGNEPGKR